MKKLLILFVLLDFVFVGVFLTIYSDNERTIASLEQTPKLTAGQNQKLEVIKNFKFKTSKDEVILYSDFLQSICATYVLIELRFKASKVAFSGQQPLIRHTYSCREISQTSGQASLPTSIEDLKSLHKNHLIKKNSSQLKSTGIYSDEELPNAWLLFEIGISGESSFTISETELNSVLGPEAFKFELTTF